MKRRTLAYIIPVFLLPLLLGVGILGYWYYTVRLEKKILLPHYGAVPSFSLTTERAETYTHRDFRGNVHIVDFIFTQCGGSCPVMSSKMHDLQDTFSIDAHLKLLSFSVDPMNDTPPVLAGYAESYRAASGRWTFLTGPRDTIFSLIRGGFHLGVDNDSTNGIMHSEKFVLVDYDGEIRGYYDSGDEQSMHALISDARSLLRNTDQ